MELTVQQLVRPLWVLVAATMMVDALTTGLAFTMLAQYDPREANPVFVWLFDRIGVVAAMTLKAVVGVVTVWFLARRAANVTGKGDGRGMLFIRKLPRWKIQRDAVWTMAVMFLVMGLVCGNNIRAVIVQAAA